MTVEPIARRLLKSVGPTLTANEPRITPVIGTFPVRRSHPILIHRWTSLWRQEFVELRRGNILIGSGWVDDITADEMVPWTLNRRNGQSDDPSLRRD